MTHQILLPEGWPRPSGYAHGVLARGAMLFTGGIIGWDEAGRFAGADIASQFERILVNTVATLAAGGARPEHIVRMTWYVTSRDAYSAALREIGASYRRHIGRHYPAMAVVEVANLVEPDALIEIETTAVIPDEGH
ncbi:RidA family protein [Sphingomonas sp. GlSt437]|uniref:RidA family protein n=1 Tax=Sphingomonas sp. GlSt437 TaxID=3389970 RepID=UPI003A89A58C